MSLKEKNVAFISLRLKNQFEELRVGKFEDKQLYEFINKAINNLKENPLCGIRIPKRLWPKEYIQNYNITNLWKYDFPNAWRLIYTLEANEVKIVSIILNWMNHKDYDRLFRY